MNGLAAALILILTVVSAVTLGIYSAYTAVLSILFALAPQSSGNRVLIPSETHASGD